MFCFSKTAEQWETLLFCCTWRYFFNLNYPGYILGLVYFFQKSQIRKNCRNNSLCKHQRLKSTDIFFYHNTLCFVFSSLNWNRIWDYVYAKYKKPKIRTYKYYTPLLSILCSKYVTKYVKIASYDLVIQTTTYYVENKAITKWYNQGLSWEFLV